MHPSGACFPSDTPFSSSTGIKRDAALDARSCYYLALSMAKARNTIERMAGGMAADLLTMLKRERLVPRFVDSYVVAHGRYSLQVHPTQYRELLELVHREAVLAMTACVFQQLSNRESGAFHRRREGPSAISLRRKFLAALAREHKWSAGDSLDFQADLHLYEDLMACRPGSRSSHKPFEAADHPFVDRCAILLDPSFLEQARVAASRVLAELQEVACVIVTKFFQGRSPQRVRLPGRL